MSEYNPTLEFRDGGDESTVIAIVSDSQEDAVNEIYIRERYQEFPETPFATLTGDGEVEIVLGEVNLYYGKLISKLNADETTEEVFEGTEVLFNVVGIPPEEEENQDGDIKNIKNVNLESITNPFYGNQFLAYFIKIPQIGYDADRETKALKPYNVDRINESIRTVTLPETSVAMIPLTYYGHQNFYYMGVGDGELGQISINMKLDRYMYNYTSFIHWSYLKYDWTFGGKNPEFAFSHKDMEGIFMVEFLDAGEERTRKLSYRLIIDSVTGLNMGVDTPDDIDFEVTLRVTDVDTSQFIMGEPLSERVRIL
jgi:hypothetical protein